MSSQYSVSRMGAFALLLCCLIAPVVWADGVVETGRKRFVPWKLGLEGVNTNDGFVITAVKEKYPATRLGRDYAFTLEPGDRIVEVNGAAINRNWTLQKALGYSSGKVDFKYWDDRTSEYCTFRGVRLVR